MSFNTKITKPDKDHEVFNIFFALFPFLRGLRVKSFAMAFVGTAFCILNIFPAEAAEYTYAPANCEFRLKFPGEPYHTSRCNPDDPKKCQDVTSYTKVFDLHASVNFKVTCNPVTENMYERYSGDVMKTTLTAIAEAQQLETFQTGFHQSDLLKQAILMGTGKGGNSDKLYVAQLWIGHESVMMIEGELLGVQMEEAEDMFAAILKSASHRSADPPKEEGTEEKTEEPAKKENEETAEETVKKETPEPAPAPAEPKTTETKAPEATPEKTAAPAETPPADQAPVKAEKKPGRVIKMPRELND